MTELRRLELPDGRCYWVDSDDIRAISIESERVYFRHEGQAAVFRHHVRLGLALEGGANLTLMFTPDEKIPFDALADWLGTSDCVTAYGHELRKMFERAFNAPRH